MNSRSKVVEVSGKNYQIRRLPPEVGSFIFMRMLGLSMRAAADAPAPKKGATPEPSPIPDDAPKSKATGEMRVKALAFAVFSGAIGFEDFKFIQRECMKCVSRMEEGDLPMPVMADDGEWTKNGEEITVDVGLTVKLTQEVLVLCFADFFEEGSPGL